MSLSRFYQNTLLSLLFRGQPIPAPEAYYVGIGRDVNELSTSMTINEPLNYMRKAIEHTEWTAGNPATNIYVIEWFAPTDWGRITHFLVFDALLPNSGNIVCFGLLKAELNIQSGEWVTFAPGDVVIHID